MKWFPNSLDWPQMHKLSKYVWYAIGTKWLSGPFVRVLPAWSWEMPVERELPAKLGRCWRKPPGHNFDFRAKSSLHSSFWNIWEFVMPWFSVPLIYFRIDWHLDQRSFEAVIFGDSKVVTLLLQFPITLPDFVAPTFSYQIFKRPLGLYKRYMSNIAGTAKVALN